MTRVLAGLVLLALLAAPMAAQETGVDGVMDSLAGLWARADAAAIARLGAVAGIEMEVDGAPTGPLAGRKMVAELRRVFANRETIRVVPSMTARVVGADDRAFGEFTWEVRPSGASLPERSTVFVALVRERAGWRVSQIRLLP